MIRHSSLVAWGDDSLRESFASSDFHPEHAEHQAAARRHAHDPPSSPTLLVLTTLSAGTGDHLDKVARHAAALGVRLTLAYYAGTRPTGLVDPLARLAQRARYLRRQHALSVDTLPHELHSRRELLRLTSAATLTCLLDANERPLHARLGPDLLSLLLRQGRGPLWVVNAAHEAAPGGLCCLAKLLPAESRLLRWARGFARGQPVQFVHVIESDMPLPDARNAVEMTVFDHVLREWRVRAIGGLEALASPLRAAGEDTAYLVLSGDVDEQLQRHVRQARPSMVLLGHRPRPWSITAARSRVRAAAGHGADVLLVPMPRERWWNWLWQRIAPQARLGKTPVTPSFFHGV